MNILFLSINFNINVNGIYTDLMKELKDKGNNIYTVSVTERKNKRDTFYEIHNGIHILKVKTFNIQKINIIEKAIATIFLEYQFINAIKKYYSEIEFDLVINATPPITFQKVIEYIKKRDGAKSYLLLKDIFPQNAVDMKIIKNKSIPYKIFREKEKKLYNNSDVIGCMSPKNKEYILKHNKFLSAKKVEICPNSIKVRTVNRISIREKAKIRETMGINKDCILLIYGGNLGKPQGLSFLIDILKSNKKNYKVHFLIIGNGTEYKRLNNAIDKENFSNVTLISRLPKEQYDEFVKCSDLGMIFLDRNFTIPNFPSRLLTYMEYSIPIIAATDKNTDIGTIIEYGDFGYWCESGDLEKFNNLISKAINNKKELVLKGENGRKYLEKNYTVDICANKILEHFI